MKEEHYLFKERGEYRLRLGSVVAAASHFVCGRSQGCRRLRFRGKGSEGGRERGAGKLCCFIRTRWESFVEASMPLSLFASRQQWIDMIILWCLRFNSTKVFHVMIFMRREPLADLLAVSERAVRKAIYFFLCLKHLNAVTCDHHISGGLSGFNIRTLFRAFLRLRFSALFLRGPPRHHHHPPSSVLV